MKRLLERRDAWGNPASVWIAAAAAFLIPLILLGLSRVRLENDISNWLPAEDPAAQTFSWAREHFASQEKVIATWRNSSLDDPRVNRFAQSLRGRVDQFGVRRGGSEYIEQVLTSADALRAMTEHGVATADAKKRMTGLLIGSVSKTAGSPATAVVLTLSAAGEADHSAAITAIRDAAAAAGVPAEELALGGTPVAGMELSTTMKAAVWNRNVPAWQFWRKSPVLLSLVVSAGLAFVLLWNIRLAAFVLAASLLAALATVAVVPFTGHGMNVVLVIMPTLLLVLTLSAAIHLSGYYRRAAQDGEPDPALISSRHAATPCLLAGLTTALGLLSLVTSSLTPVQEFGAYSAIGCGLLLLVVLWLLPAVLQLWPVTAKSPTPQSGRFWAALSDGIARHSRAVLCGSLILMALAGAGLSRFRTESRAICYFPEHSRVVQDYRFIEDNLCGIIPLDVIVAFDADQQKTPFVERLELVRRVSDAIRQHPQISGAVSLADFQPVTELPPAHAAFLEKAKYFRRSATVEDRVKAAGGSAEHFLTQCRTAAPQFSSTTAPAVAPGSELWRIGAQAFLLAENDLSALTTDIQASVDETLQSEHPPQRFVTGAVPLFLRTQQAVLDSLVVSFGLAFALIAAVMSVLLRSIVAGLLAMLPNLLPVVVVFGAISWAGIAVDIGTMITASVALGVAVDGTLHLCQVFRERARQTNSATEALRSTLVACGPPLWQTTAVVSFGLLMMAGSELLLIARFGWIMAALVATALLGDLLLLPALLAGPLGRSLMPKTTGVTTNADIEGGTRTVPRAA